MAIVPNVTPAAGPPPSTVVTAEAVTDEEMMNNGIGAMPTATASLEPSVTPGVVENAPPPASPAPAQTAAMRGFRIQLLSTKSPTDTEKGWIQLQAAYSDLLADLQFEVTKADLGATKGVWYRGFAGPIADRDEANLLCTIIRSRSPHNDCFVAGY
jgi:hypothetical protein